MTTTSSEVQTKARAAREASRSLARLSTDIKNRALLNIAASLLDHEGEILSANKSDIEGGRESGLSDAVLDRLLLTRQRLEGMASDVRTVSSLPDPVGESIDMRRLPNGLQVGRRRVPLGVIAAIYESRPNVTVDIASLCLKSGNACVLRGGKEALNSNKVLAAAISEAIRSAGVTEAAVQLISNPDRALVGELLAMREYIDLAVPRGGAELIRFVVRNATMPVLTGGTGVCHTYIDKAADVEKAVTVAHNAKCRKYSICNALDTLIVHSSIAGEVLPAIARSWTSAGIEIRCDEPSLLVLEGQDIPGMKHRAASEEDFGKEFLAPIAAVKTVDTLEDALEHIYRYGTGHSDAIITEDYTAAMRFVDEVDTAVVYVNASTQFTDGAQFGLGAEIIDSTQKTIARGPVGLREITTYKWIVLGSGQTRP